MQTTLSCVFLTNIIPPISCCDCLMEVKSLLSSNFLKLNIDKTEALGYDCNLSYVSSSAVFCHISFILITQAASFHLSSTVVSVLWGHELQSHSWQDLDVLCSLCFSFLIAS